MGKVGAVAIIVGLVVVCYLILLMVMPTIVSVISTANTTMAASSNLSNYPGTQEALISTPWFLFFVPGVIGMVAIVIVLKRQ